MSSNFQKVVVIGTGYVGLPAAILLANAGFEVVGIDINSEIVNSINRNEMHINEHELKQLMQTENVKKNLSASLDMCEADVFIVAVPTPLNKRKKVADLSAVEDAVRKIVPVLKKGNLIIIESTIPPLTCKELITPILESSEFKVGTDIFLAHCPERILPGNIFHEIVHNDRLVGGVNYESACAAKKIYSTFVKGNLLMTDDVTAELCKLMENTFRDVNIALANELAEVCETLGVDVYKAISLANLHPRVNILQPGIGVGGHCLPIDPWFIKEVDPENCKLIQTARGINDERPQKIAGKIRKAVKNIVDPRIVILGVTYKKDTYDLRESPALEIVNLLLDDGYDLCIYDPLTNEYSNGQSIKLLARNADCLVFLVEHEQIIKEFMQYREEIWSEMRNPIIIRFAEDSFNEQRYMIK